MSFKIIITTFLLGLIIHVKTGCSDFDFQYSSCPDDFSNAYYND